MNVTQQVFRNAVSPGAYSVRPANSAEVRRGGHLLLSVIERPALRKFPAKFTTSGNRRGNNAHETPDSLQRRKNATGSVLKNEKSLKTADELLGEVAMNIMAENAQGE